MVFCSTITSTDCGRRDVSSYQYIFNHCISWNVYLIFFYRICEEPCVVFGVNSLLFMVFTSCFFLVGFFLDMTINWCWIAFLVGGRVCKKRFRTDARPFSSFTLRVLRCIAFVSLLPHFKDKFTIYAHDCPILRERSCGFALKPIGNGSIWGVFTALREPRNTNKKAPKNREI
jgi:hypothetical protein